MLEPGKWTKSSRCAADSPQCVEVVHVRNSAGETVQVSDGMSINVFTREEWTTFIAGVREGDFDLQ